MPKDYGELNFDKIFDKLDKMADKITKSGENVEGVAEKAGEQIGESFVGGIEQGLEDAASRIAASSLKINKAFKDLAKKITNQNISIGGINIDFSDIDIDSKDFQKKINEIFEQFKIDNAIEFDSKAAEKQFKNMLALHTKYAIKLSKLQEQRPKLTSQASIKANAQEQLAVIDGLKEIQKVLNQTSGMSIELPHVYFGDVKELRTSINLIEQLEKGEEKVVKQRIASVEKIKKENKELKERNKILEERVGPIEEGEIPPAKKPRARKPKVETPIAAGAAEEKARIEAEAAAAEKARLEEEARLQEEARKAAEARRAEEERLAKEREEAEKRALELARQRAEEEARIAAEKEKQLKLYDGYDSPAREKPAEMGKWKKAKFYSVGRGKNGPEAIAREGRTDGNYNYFKDEVTKLWHVIDKVTGMGTKTYLTFKEAQEDTYSEHMQAKMAEKKYAEASDLMKLGMSLMRDAEAAAGLPSPIATEIAAIEEQKKIAEETAAIETKADESSVVAEQTELKLAEAELEVEKEITTEKEKQHKFTRTINGKPNKFRVKKSEADQGVQTSIDDIVPASAEDVAPKVETEAKAIDEVGKAADKAAGSKKKFAKANKEVAASVTPSVDKLETEADAMEDVGEAAKKVSKTVSKEFDSVAKDTKFSTRDYEKLYDEMESFAAQRRAENGYDLSKVTVNTDAHGNPLGATIAYYKKATKESIVETFKLDKAAQEAEEGVNRLVLSSRKATAGIADFEKATLGAINRQDQLIAQKNKTISSLSGAIDPNANRTLFGTDYEEEARSKIKAIKDEVAKLDQEIDGERTILSEKEFLKTKRRIAELTQEARDFINASKNAEYAPTQLESHSVSSGNQYRADQLKAQIEDWKRAGIYVGDLKVKADELAQSVTNITKHEDLKKYLEGMKEARALAKLATQDKKAEEERQKALNKEYEEYIALIAKRDAIESKMIGLDAVKDRDELAALRADYDAVDNELNDKYGDFLSRRDVQERFSIGELASTDDAARRKMAIKEGRISDKKRLEEEAAAQQKVNEKYREYIRLIQERGRKEKELVGLDPKKNKEQINTITARIDEIDEKLNKTYGDLLSNKIAQATLTLEDFMKYYDKWQQEIAEKEAKAADKARNKKEKPYLDYGKTTANSTKRKLDVTQGEVDALGVTNPEILAKMDDYRAKAQKVLDIRDKFAKNPKAAKDPALVKQFQKMSYEAETARRSIKAVLDEEQRMMQMSMEQGFVPVELSADQIANLENEMVSYAKATAQGRMEIKGWNGDHTKMYYTVTDSKGAVEEMTMALGEGTNKLIPYRTAVKETGTLMQQILKGIKVKAKELLSFVIGGGSVYKVIELLRQGIQYVREIDLALTELKKVTDETEETYDKFLDTAAKTGARLGSTISAVTEATATFAKLGYSMKQATEMAEAAIVYKNVGDNIASTEDAADSIISTMKGFKLEATESMEIVDRFNEVKFLPPYTAMYMIKMAISEKF